MSRSQHPHLFSGASEGQPAPAHATDIRSEEQQFVGVPILPSNVSRMVIGGDVHREMLAAQDLEHVKKDIEECSLEIKDKIATCTL